MPARAPGAAGDGASSPSSRTPLDVGARLNHIPTSPIEASSQGSYSPGTYLRPSRVNSVPHHKKASTRLATIIFFKG